MVLDIVFRGAKRDAEPEAERDRSKCEQDFPAATVAVFLVRSRSPSTVRFAICGQGSIASLNEVRNRREPLDPRFGNQ